MFDRKLLQIILRDYRLDPKGIHGVSHWKRVVRYGLEMSAITGADKKIVLLFGLLHDSCRQDNGLDIEHGRRAAKYVEKLAAQNILRLSPEDLKTLADACAGHNRGLGPYYRPNVTVQTCWDADKLDLHRFGYAIDPKRLWTEEAIRRAACGEFIVLA